MGYQEELQAKLDAVRTIGELEHGKRVSTSDLENQLVQELEEEFELSQYDLDESDILRAIKISTILQEYPEVFSHPNALRVFYALAKTDVIHARNLFKLSKIDSKAFKQLVSNMIRSGLICMNEEKEFELSMQGQSLAERIGVNVFI